MIYLDANFFLLANFDQTGRGEKARQLHGKIISGTKAATCALALDEVMWVVLKNKRRDLLREVVEDVYALQNLMIKEVSGSIPLDALALVEEFNLRPRDAIHAAVMKANGISEIASSDSDFDRIRGIKRIRL